MGFNFCARPDAKLCLTTRSARFGTKAGLFLQVQRTRPPIYGHCLSHEGEWGPPQSLPQLLKMFSSTVSNVEMQILPRPGRVKGPGPHSPPHPANAMFSHSIITRANAVKFAQQSLCNPNISSIKKATQRGYLKECPGINEILILKCLNPSPATAKGHMKHPQYGIKSTRGKPNPPASKVPQPIPQINVPIIPLGNEMHAYRGPAYGMQQDPRWIDTNEGAVQ